MSAEDPELQKALATLQAAGYSQPVAFASSSSQLTGSKQNNTIIELLVSLHKKLDIFLEIERQKNLEKTIEDLSTKIKNLNLGNSTEDHPVIKAKSKGIYVWKDPHEAIAEYKRQQKTHK